MAAAIDRGDLKCVGEPVERQRPRQRNDVPAIDQPPPEPSFALDELIEMNARGVLIEPGRNLMLGFLDRDAVDMIDSLADVVVAETVRAAGERKVIGGNV